MNVGIISIFQLSINSENSDDDDDNDVTSNDLVIMIIMIQQSVQLRVGWRRTGLESLFQVDVDSEMKWLVDYI